MLFAPVASIHVAVVRNPYSVVAVGWAAPAGGHMPCALQLVAGSEMLALAKATRFSAGAARGAQRLGWCGFRIGDLSAGAALADDIQLVCAATGEVQMRWTAGDVVQRAAPAPRTRHTFPEFRAALQRQSGCEDENTILPFARHLQRTQGDHALVVACYRWVLRRTPALAEAEEFLRSITEGDMVQVVIGRLLGSDEYRNNPKSLSGPFEGAFPFGLGALDEA